MFDIGLSELLIILVVALIVLGPRKLPEIARKLGRGVAEFRRTTEELRSSILMGDDAGEKPPFTDSFPARAREKPAEPGSVPPAPAMSQKPSPSAPEDDLEGSTTRNPDEG
jgi:TatA/E family protein of Tat protein translocase